ncbi:hypothetical protein [Cryobacterium tepidiphilum]|uniref:hypothetical protein n=1 Tax=Cryobacterium tepidiphilum TaxID=2486026 RepID=UPI001F23CA0B|nr:hypothetical protein [Cryobacterium tepidiphilum]
MTRPADLPLSLTTGPFSTREARNLGVNDGRLRRSDLRRPFRGVRSLKASESFDEAPANETVEETWTRARSRNRVRAHEYATRMPDGQFFSHITAAFLHGLPLPSRFRDIEWLDVSTMSRSLRRTGSGVRGHFASTVTRVVYLETLPVASAVDVWCQLSTTLTLDELVIMGDALVRRKSPPATMQILATAVARCSGRPGAKLLREALALVRPRTDSPRETMLRLIIVRANLPEPEVNLELRNRYGAFMAWGDLVYREHKILLEYDGEVHRVDEKQFQRDVDRLDEIMEEDWRVIRYNKSHLGTRRNEVEGKVRRALLAKGWNP